MTKPPPPPPSNHKPAMPPAPQTYQQVLREAGYPDRCVVWDFENFFSSDYGLKTHSIPGYIADKRFEVVALAVKNDDLPAYVLIGEAEVEEYLRSVWLENVTVLTHNAAFDAMVLAMKYGIHPPHLIDTVNLARAFHSRSRHGLKDLAKKFSLPDKGDTKEFLDCTLRPGRYRLSKKGPPARLPVMTADQVESIKKYAGHDAELTWDIFKILLPRLSNPKTELRLMDHTLRLWTKPSLRFDFGLGRGIVQKMEARADAAVREVMNVYGVL